MEILYASLAMFAFVFLRAFQSRNVNHDQYLPVIPTSWLMFAGEAYVIATVASVGWNFWFVFAVGTAAGLGCILAMVLHRRLFRQRRSPFREMTWREK